MTIFILVKDVSMSMRKSASFNILPRNSDVVSLVNKRSKREGFSSTPVNSFLLFYRIFSSLKDFDNLWMEIAIFGQS